jgi:hypothetical protein
LGSGGGPETTPVVIRAVSGNTGADGGDCDGVDEGPDFDGVPELQAELPRTAAPTTAATEPARADLLEIAPSIP